MIVFRIPVVIPTKLDWLLLLFLIGLAGFGGQVRHPPDPYFMSFDAEQVLLTLGLQRETAGRGTIAIYGQGSALVYSFIYMHANPN